MNSKDLLAKYPEKSFSEKFEEKENAIRGIGAPIDQIQAKKTEYNKLFQFDTLLQKLKIKLQENPDKEISDYAGSRTAFLLSQLGSIISYLENLGYSEPNNVNKIFENFQQATRHFFENIRYNIDSQGISSGRQLIDEHIKEVHDIIKEFGVHEIDRQKIEEAEKIARQLIENSGKYEKARQTAESWIKSEGIALSSSLKDKAQIFNNKAEQDHKSKKIWWWFGGSVIGGIIAFITILCFVFKNGTDVSIGSSLLRIAAMIVISYFSFFCMQQFSNHRKLYEIYRFKAIALNTMEELIKSYPDPAERERILNKAINIIFSEPNLRDDSNVQKKLVDELFEIIKKKI